ncbi:transcriptional regulator, AraC family [Rhizobium sp. PDO1-076]|uniref:helix-turn-helix domain-containing protein n=1 Tax=Rhizobium sp. PDO1-076 TaxID=1125979 RepID=UPI00024E3E44|nr:helix-turn-helix domain-containing protein [Rhizobium sp. PDO1-076]EHS52555.1 transcriptional regulator, AraC family [Rhizobium sp. PDO1-076]
MKFEHSTNQGLDKALREDRFTTLVKEKSEQFPYWRNLIASIAEVEPVDVAVGGFKASIRGVDLGKVHIASLRLDAMKYRRTTELIRRSGLDHWQITLRHRGSETNCSAGDTLRSQEGSLDLRSLAMPCMANSSSGDLTCIWMQRDAFPTLAGTLDAACHRPMRGISKKLLREFILSLQKYRSTLTYKDIPIVVNSLTALLGVLVRPTKDRMEMAATPISASRIEIARKLIDANLKSPDLGVDMLCRELGVSRRKLYYLLERRGGVYNFIRERRLAACHAALENASDGRLISTIAYENGFSDPAQFSRLFKVQYGYSAKEARELCYHENVPAAGGPRSFAQWLLQAERHEMQDQT